MPHKEKPKKNQTADNFFDDYVSACCTTDCTGLIQIPPRSAAEQDAYLEIYQYGPPAPPEEDDQ